MKGVNNMNLQELLNQINAKKLEVKNLVEQGKIENSLRKIFF